MGVLNFLALNGIGFLICNLVTSTSTFVPFRQVEVSFHDKIAQMISAVLESK